MHSRAKTDVICFFLNTNAQSRRLLHQAMFSLQLKTASQIRTRDTEGRLVSAEHPRALRAWPQAAAQPEDEATALAASDTTLRKVVFYNNLFKLQFPPRTSLLPADLLHRLNISILTGYPAFWKITWPHFLNLSWNGAGLWQSLTNHTRLFRAFHLFDFRDQLHIRIAIGGKPFFSHILPNLLKSLLTGLFTQTPSLRTSDFQVGYQRQLKAVSTVQTKPLHSILYSRVDTHKTKERREPTN